MLFKNLIKKIEMPDRYPEECKDILLTGKIKNQDPPIITRNDRYGVFKIYIYHIEIPKKQLELFRKVVMYGGEKRHCCQGHTIGLGNNRDYGLVVYLEGY